MPPELETNGQTRRSTYIFTISCDFPSRHKPTRFRHFLGISCFVFPVTIRYDAGGFQYTQWQWGAFVKRLKRVVEGQRKIPGALMKIPFKISASSKDKVHQG